MGVSRAGTTPAPRSGLLEDHADVVVFTNLKVTITGRNLTPLFKALTAHKVAWIWEVDPLAEPVEDAATVVNGIDFGEV